MKAQREPVFHKSSYSAQEGSCVEVSEGEAVLVRDTQNRQLGHLTFTPSAWEDFLSDLKTDRLYP